MPYSVLWQTVFKKQLLTIACESKGEFPDWATMSAIPAKVPLLFTKELRNETVDSQP
jgi:hypothetical protein